MIIVSEPKCALADIAECEQRQIQGTEDDFYVIKLVLDLGHATAVSTPN